MDRLRSALLFGVIALGVVVLPRAVSANILLELRPGAQTVNVGEPADVGLYAVSDSSSDQLISAADVLFTWDPTKLNLLWNDDTGGAPNLTSGFPTTDPWGNINGNASFFDPPTGGTGFYQIYAGFGSPIHATQAGTLLTTFAIDAIAETPLTTFSLVLHAGVGGQTKVYDGTIPNLDVTGSLGQADITILPEPATLTLLMLGSAAFGYRRRPCRA